MPGLFDALEYIGGSLHKPGRAVRGALAGKPRELLAAVPFSDTLGITDPAQRTSGRELSDKLGLTRTGDQGWGSWSLGLGTELATDPLNLIPGSFIGKALGKTKAGQAAERGLKNFHRDQEGSLRLDYLSALKDESTPLGRLKSLADTSGVHVFPERPKGIYNTLEPAELASSDKVFDSFMNRISDESPGAVALYSPENRWVVPAMEKHHELWFNPHKMAASNKIDHLDRRIAAGYPDSLSVHEIGHGLHHQNLFDPKDPSYYPYLYENLGLPGTDRNAIGIGNLFWADDLNLDKSIEANLSRYALKDPREFTAEAFSKMAGDLASGATSYQAQSIPPNLWDLYHRKLSGPAVPYSLSQKLKQYMERDAF